MIPSEEGNSQWSILAGLRFVLATCVLITHSGIVAPGYFLARWLDHTGFPAVFGFFMVSGYSIAASITARRDGYLIRRVRRIYPAYLFAIAFACTVTIGGSVQLPLGQILMPPNWKTIVGNVLMLQGIFVDSPPADGALWSLSIEWWCYMLAPFLIRFSNRLAVYLMLVSFAAMLAHYGAIGLGGKAQFPVGINLVTMGWAWLSGFVYFRVPSKTNFLFMLILPLVTFDVFLPLQFADMVIVVSALTLLLAKTTRVESAAAARWLDFLGNASYPLYLVHAPLLYLITTRTSIHNGNILILIVLVLVLSGYYAVTVLQRRAIGGLQKWFSGIADWNRQPKNLPWGPRG
jgi:peptidoglycan/LPS O-acetylase OafA/YrhL